MKDGMKRGARAGLINAAVLLGLLGGFVLVRAALPDAIGRPILGGMSAYLLMTLLLPLLIWGMTWRHVRLLDRIERAEGGDSPS